MIHSPHLNDLLQGMSFIAAILILNLDEADAFIMFANLLNWPLLTSFFSVDQQQVIGLQKFFCDIITSFDL